MKQALLIFLKNEIKGKVKTRLAATLGEDVAFNIYKKLLAHTEKCVHSLLLHKIVCYADYIEAEDIWSNDIYEKKIQIGSDLGERMQNAFENAFADGNNQVAIIGSDCFEITPAIIESAFKQLEHNDVVFGPALDGGYYLLALKSNHKSIFQNIQWSTEKVLSETIQICHKMGLKTAKLKELSDIDTELDLKRMDYHY